MKPSHSLAVFSLAAVAAAALDPVDPQVTARAQLERRQADPALLGYVESGGSRYSDLRSCDFPATLSTSNALAQCCSGSDCIFWSSCSAGTLFAQSTSLRCDQGFCNTAVLVATPGASSGESYLGCWATSLGQDAFTIVRDVGSAVATPTESASASASETAASNTRASSSRSSSDSASASVSRSTENSGTATQSSTSTAQSSGAAVANAATPFSGALGLGAMLLGLL